jgi:hypothetical protein
MILSGFRRGDGSRPNYQHLLFFLLLLTVMLTPSAGRGRQKEEAGGQVSKVAADSCEVKVKALQDYAESPGRAAEKRTTRISEAEINSYLALDLSPKYTPSLKSIQFAFSESTLQSTAMIDFDVLGAGSKKLSTRLFAGMFSGIHKLMVRGKLVSDGGKAYFQLHEARFDASTIPNFLVEEIITTVGRKQKPPFDPMQPSQMPYHIEKVEIHPGYILIYQ